MFPSHLHEKQQHEYTVIKLFKKHKLELISGFSFIFLPLQYQNIVLNFYHSILAYNKLNILMPHL